MEKKLVPRKVFYNPIYRDKATVLKSASETGGLYSLGELEISPGGGNAMHVHSAFEETFTAIRGELGVVLSGKLYKLRPGESITVPKNTPHHFINKSGEIIVCQVRFVPGHEGFVKGLAIAYGLATDGRTTKKRYAKKSNSSCYANGAHRYQAQWHVKIYFSCIEMAGCKSLQRWNPAAIAGKILLSEIRPDLTRNLHY